MRKINSYKRLKYGMRRSNRWCMSFDAVILSLKPYVNSHLLSLSLRNIQGKMFNHFALKYKKIHGVCVCVCVWWKNAYALARTHII